MGRSQLIIALLGFSLVLNVSLLFERWGTSAEMRADVISAALSEEKVLRISCEDNNKKKEGEEEGEKEIQAQPNMEQVVSMTTKEASTPLETVPAPAPAPKSTEISTSTSSSYGEIPKKIHFVYVSPGFPDEQDPVPEHYNDNLKGWADLHPDYTVTLWNNALMKKEFPEIPELLKDVTAMAWVSDMLRYHVIQKYGGIYLDMDIAPVQSLEFLRSNYGPGFTDCEDHATRKQPRPVKSVEKYTVPHTRYSRGTVGLCRNINNNVIASVPNHPVMKCIIDKSFAASIEDLAKDPNPKYRLARTGPKQWQKCAFSYEDINIFHSSLFHPCGFFDRDTCNVETYKGQGHVYGMHEWKGSWKNGGKGMGSTAAEKITGKEENAASQRRNLRQQTDES